MASLSIARAYQHSFDTHPNITLAITGGCLNSLGDIVAQVTEKTVRSQCLPRRLLSPNIPYQWGRSEHDHYQQYDFSRTLRFFCFGFTISTLC